ncbi:hypothetical protein L3556_13920 [Candidatus Synechococcus calcipolaris G9]|uniref:Transcriptional regulator n=1 Tax=Candidatus Synechococcus calcipolaris G9 TaxID=1497997 RepID=A0ABT6F2F1_9SYNE|nr:hypothetical protein [Candidatus Synechococcus calcipolaris]MDG2992018.1 hypothetical protein [Candidatus Synechococcus calcipolaris G9]
MTDAEILYEDEALTSIKDYLERTRLKRPTLYSRMNALGIEPVKIGRNSFLTEDQIKELERLHEHLGRGRSVADFGIDDVIDTPTSSTQLTKKMSAALASSRSMEGLMLLAEAFADATRPDVGQVLLNRLRLLEEAAQNEWVFSTGELAELLGVSGSSLTKHQAFRRHGFNFVRTQSQGRSVQWCVSKTTS